MGENILFEMFRDKMIFLSPLGNGYQRIGMKYFKVGGSKVRYKKRTYNIPAAASLINKFGKRTYYMEFESANQIVFSGTKNNSPFTAKQMDLFVSSDIIESFARSFAKKAKENWLMLIMTLGFGIGIGYMVCSMLMLGMF